MLSNTGTISFWFYGIFIAITVLAMVIGFYQIVKGKIELAKLDKMVELFKYAIVSVAISTGTLIVADLFKEREQDIKELEYFHKYVEDVKKADGIEARLRLSKYLSIVAPSGEMRESWKRYYAEVNNEYREYLVLKANEYLNQDWNMLSEEQIKKAQENQAAIKMYESPLAGDNPKKSRTVYIQYCDKAGKEGVTEIQKRFNENSWKAPGIEYMEGGCDNSIRYFHDEDRAIANEANTLLGGKYEIKKIDLKAPRGQIELWIGN